MKHSKPPRYHLACCPLVKASSSVITGKHARPLLKCRMQFAFIHTRQRNRISDDEFAETPLFHLKMECCVWSEGRSLRDLRHTRSCNDEKTTINSLQIEPYSCASQDVYGMTRHDNRMQLS